MTSCNSTVTLSVRSIFILTLFVFVFFIFLHLDPLNPRSRFVDNFTINEISSETDAKLTGLHFQDPFDVPSKPDANAPHIPINPNEPRGGFIIDHTPLVWTPGNLTQPTAEVFRKCWSRPKDWGKHRKTGECTISRKARLIYYHIPVSDSENERKYFDQLGGSYKKDAQPCSHRQSEVVLGYRAFTVVRNPIRRFFSQFMEAEWRANRSAQHAMRKFPIWNIADEEERFVAYIDMWHKDGFGQLLDTHLRLQTPMFTYIDGNVRALDFVVKMEELTEGWKSMSDYFGIRFRPLEFARKNNERALNDKLVPDRTKRKLCQIIAQDYCCLNYKLPKVCEGAVFCKYTARFPVSKDALRTIQPLLPEVDSNFTVREMEKRVMREMKELSKDKLKRLR